MFGVSSDREPKEWKGSNFSRHAFQIQTFIEFSEQFKIMSEMLQ